jgi:hypothetical protein
VLLMLLILLLLAVGWHKPHVEGMCLLLLHK